MQRRTFLKLGTVTLLSRMCFAASRFRALDIRVPIAQDNCALTFDEKKCTECGKCLEACRDDSGVFGRYDLAKTGDKPVCMHCGQCSAACEGDAIRPRDEWDAVADAIADDTRTVVVSLSPAVRVSLGEAFGGSPGANTEGQMIAALRALGADVVLDTTFGADLTVMEEGAEFRERLASGGRLPLFTSCCPAWVKYAETFYPELLPHLSTARSPIAMQGSTIKTWFAAQRRLDPASLFTVALAPCTAKKFEVRRKGMTVNGLRATDAVLTVRELAAVLKRKGINPLKLPESRYDEPMGRGSGAAVIFGSSGGVTEAVLRTVYRDLTGTPPTASLLKFDALRGLEPVRTAETEIAGRKVRVAVIHGTARIPEFLTRLKSGAVKADLVEVMACRGGCAGGAGLPRTAVPMTDAVREARRAGLYKLDDAIRVSGDNPQIRQVYSEFYGAPLGAVSRKYLHTAYIDRSSDLES